MDIWLFFLAPITPANSFWKGRKGSAVCRQTLNPAQRLMFLTPGKDTHFTFLRCEPYSPRSNTINFAHFSKLSYVSLVVAWSCERSVSISSTTLLRTCWCRSKVFCLFLVGVVFVLAVCLLRSAEVMSNANGSWVGRRGRGHKDNMEQVFLFYWTVDA
jgi:hypothetical protein